MKTIIFLSLAAIIITAAIPALACYSGLVLIPSADTVGAKQYSVELQMDGSISKPKADTFYINSQVGITDNVEVGVDYDLSKGVSSRVLLNAKYRFIKSADGKQAAAIGICNLTSKNKSNPYLAGTQDFNILRGHVGLMEINEKTRFFIGIDRDINDKLNLMADYTSGDDNYSSIGANYQITDKFGVLAGVQLPNGGGETLYTLHFCFSGELVR
ncbi:MAG: hypothetical protein WCO98_06645 [bacterium]